ncbi:MAG: hypothetical protein ABUL54_06220 [Dongia sp.]
MKRILLALAVFVGAAFASGPSWAITIDLNTLPSGVNVTPTQLSGTATTFSQEYKFTLAAASTLFAIAGGPTGSAPLPVGTFGLQAISIELDDSAHSFITASSSASSVSLTQVLAAGTYFAIISGEKLAGAKSFFETTTFLAIDGSSPVTTPIPAAGLMLLTAVGAMGGLAFRRKRGV